MASALLVVGAVFDVIVAARTWVSAVEEETELVLPAKETGRLGRHRWSTCSLSSAQLCGSSWQVALFSWLVLSFFGQHCQCALWIVRVLWVFRSGSVAY